MPQRRGFIYTGLIFIIALIILSTILVLKTNSYMLIPGTIRDNPIFSNLPTGKQSTFKIFSLEDSRIKRLATLPKTEPTTFGIIDPILSGNKIFYLDGMGLYSYDLNNKLVDLVFSLDENYEYYRITTGKDNIYLSYFKKEGSDFDPDYLTKINKGTNTASTLGPFKVGPLSGLGYYADIATKELFYISGGDACAGWFDIHSNSSNKLISILGTGSGCFSGPQLLGHDGQKIYYANAMDEELEYWTGENLYDEIFSYDVLSDNISSITKLLGLENTHFTSIFYSVEANLFFGINKSELVIFNGNTQEFKIIELTGEFINLFTAPDKAYLITEEPNIIYVLDYTNQKLTPINLNGTIAQQNLGSIIYLGDFNEKPLFSILNLYE